MSTTVGSVPAVDKMRKSVRLIVCGFVALVVIGILTYQLSIREATSKTNTTGAETSIPIAAPNAKPLKITVPPGECVETPPVRETGKVLQFETTGILNYRYPDGTACKGSGCAGGWRTVCVENATTKPIDAYVLMLPK